MSDLLVDGFIHGTQWHAGTQQPRDKEEKEKEEKRKVLHPVATARDNQESHLRPLDHTLPVLEGVRLQCPVIPEGHMDGHSVALRHPHRRSD